MSDDTEMRFFSDRLLVWYRRGNRDLPWRRSRDPYHIWVSEVMLQQTRVETVIPYYRRFLDRFPTIDALADAPEEEVLKLWEGLGYYSRARNLQSAVREVKERYGSVVPDTKEHISTLRGVGPYTSGAILSIAYNKPEPAVDGNVMRVLSRFFLIEDDIMKPGTRTVMEKLARELIPEGAAGDFNQALMELGALVCTPRSPHCLTCPVMERCAARHEGREESLPTKKKAKPPRPEHRLVALVEGAGEHAGKVLLRQRPQEGLLARMWELPHVAIAAAADGAGGGARRGRARAAAAGDGERRELAAAGGALLAAEAAAAYAAAAAAEAAGEAEQQRLLRETLLREDGVAVQPLAPYMTAEHTFSHIRWELGVFRCRPDDLAGSGLPQLLPFHYRWAGPDELEQYALPNVFVRILREYYGAGGVQEKR